MSRLEARRSSGNSVSFLLDSEKDGTSSHRSRSRKTTSSGDSLLSATNLELVLDMIDTHYAGPGEDEPTGQEDLLGNLGPGPADARRPVMAVPTSTANRQSSPDGTTDVVTGRALAVAKADGKRLEELLTVLDCAPARARTVPGVSREKLQQLELEVRETRVQLRNLLAELREIQTSFVEDLRPSSLAPKLAALAHWQESVLHNPLIARARHHTQTGGERAPQSLGAGSKSMHHFLEQPKQVAASSVVRKATVVQGQRASASSSVPFIHMWPFAATTKATAVGAVPTATAIAMPKTVMSSD